MVMRRYLPLWAWGCLAIFFGIMVVGINITFTTYTVTRYAHNECNALNYLIQHKPPGSQGHVFFKDIEVWAQRDGC